MSPQPVQELTPHERRMQARDGNRPLTASAYESSALPEPMIESPLDNNPDLFANLPVPTAEFLDMVTAQRGNSISTILSTAHPVVAANDPDSFYGTLVQSQLSGRPMDEILVARAQSATGSSGGSSLGGDILSASLGASFAAAHQYGALNRVTTYTQELAFAYRGAVTSSSVVLVNGAGDATLASRLVNESQLGIGALSQHSSELRLSNEIVPPTSTRVVEAAGGLTVRATGASAAIEASGAIRVTDVSSGSINPALAKTFSLLKRPGTGGVLEVGLNYLEGKYDLYEPTERQRLENEVGIAYDFVAGTGRGAVSGAAGVIVGSAAAAGTAATGAGAPAAPFVGMVTGAGTAIAVDTGLKRFVTDPLRPLALGATLQAYDYYRAAVDFTSYQVIAPTMSYFGR